MENNRLNKIVMIGSFVLLAILVVGYLWQAFFRKDEDKAEREKIREQRAREVEELARMNDLLQQQLDEAEKLPAVNKGAKLVDLTPERKEPGKAAPPATGKPKRNRPPQANKKQTAAPGTPAAAGTI